MTYPTRRLRGIFLQKNNSIKRHLQETVRNRKLAKNFVRDRYSLEKLLEEAQADEEANANELEVTAKETQNTGKQDNDANVNRVEAGK